MDQLIHEKETEVTQVRDMVIQRVDRVELLLKQMAKLLASNTNYATLISGPQYHQTTLEIVHHRENLLDDVLCANLIHR